MGRPLLGTPSVIGIDLAPERFRYIGTNSYVWAVRAVPPIDHGSHTVSNAMLVELTGEEIAAIKLNRENSEIMWIAPREIVSREKEFGGAVVIQICKDYLTDKSVS